MYRAVRICSVGKGHALSSGKMFRFVGIFGEYDHSCTGEGMPSPYNQKQNLTDKSELERRPKMT